MTCTITSHQPEQNTKHRTLVPMNVLHRPKGHLCALQIVHMYVCMPCVWIHRRSRICTCTFPRCLWSGEGQKELEVPRSALMSKPQEPAHSWVAARASTGRESFREERAYWSGIILGLSGTWDCRPRFRANRDCWNLAVDTHCTLASGLGWRVGLQLLWVLAAEDWDTLSQRSTLGTMSFLAQKFTSTYKAVRRQSLSSTKGQTLAPKATNSVVRFTLQRSPWDKAEARLQPRPHPCSVASPLACCLHSISDESAPSVNHFTDPQLRLCLGNPSSFSKLLGPSTVSQVANQTPFE